MPFGMSSPGFASAVRATNKRHHTLADDLIDSPAASARMYHRVGVMYAGEIVEIEPVEEVFDVPQQPYMEALLERVALSPSRHFEG